MNNKEFNKNFSPIINDLCHTDPTNLTKAASHKARSSSALPSVCAPDGKHERSKCSL